MPRASQKPSLAHGELGAVEEAGLAHCSDDFVPPYAKNVSAKGKTNVGPIGTMHMVIR
jgi:hypothetical protein